jgi:hypothetical protein
MKGKKRVSRCLSFERTLRPKLTIAQNKGNNYQNIRQSLLGNDDGLLERAADGEGFGLLLGAGVAAKGWIKRSVWVVERLLRPKQTSGQNKVNNYQNTRQNLLGDDGLLESILVWLKM